MYRLSTPFGDDALLLTLPFPGLSRGLQLALVVLLALGLLALVLWLYRREARQVTPRKAFLLLSLRSLTLLTVLGVTCLRPVVSHTTRTTVPSKVLIALDRSDSMNETDPHRSADEASAFARGLKLSAGKPLTRKALSERVLDPAGVDLLREVAAKHAVDVIGFSRQSGDLPADWAKLKLALAGLDAKWAGSAYTDLKLPLNRAFEKGGTGAEKLVAIVVLTDGQHNWGPPPLARASELGQRGIPVYPIVCGPKSPPPDVVVAAVKASPPSVFKNAYVTVEARILVNNMPAGDVEITLEYPDVPGGPPRPPLTETIKHDGERDRYLVTLLAKMDRPGTETLRVTAKAKPVAGDPRRDTMPDNDFRDVTVVVTPDKAKVLMIDDEARWEFHYLHTALLRDETMEAKSVVFAPPRIGGASAEQLRALDYPETALPKDDAALLGNDCIILGDVSPDQLPEADRERLVKYVSDRGGTLVMVAGKRSMPLDFAKPDDPLGKLLPVSDPRAVRDDRRGFAVTLTGEGMQTGFLRLDPNPGTSLSIWEKLPPAYWGVVGRAKDGAVTLAYAPDGALPDDPAAARDAEHRGR